MNFGHWLFSLNGRINRGKYWLFVLLSIVGAVAVFSVVGGVAATSEPGSSLWHLLIVLYLLAIIYPAIAVGVKRLHDRNKSGWWLLIFWLVPAVIQAVGESLGQIATIVFSLAALGISIWGFVEIACLRGTRGPNRYGPDPLGATAVQQPQA